MCKLEPIRYSYVKYAVEALVFETAQFEGFRSRLKCATEAVVIWLKL